MELSNIYFIMGGIVVTLKYTFCSVGLGLIFASFLTAFGLSKNKFLQLFNKLYVSIFRGTPLLIQLSIIYFGLPGLIGYNIPPFVAGVMAFSLNSAAYVSETLRAGILSVDKGQFEAAKTLGVPSGMMMRDIILPQAIKTILPALVNELINMLKESALVSVIGEADLMRRANLVAAEKYTFFGPLLAAAICYYIMVLILSFLASMLQKRLTAND